jgi:hypothetical protein
MFVTWGPAMNAEDANLQFPVLGLSADNDVWGFWDLEGLTVCGHRTLKEGLQDGMELIDAAGERWRVDRIRMIRPLDPWWKWILTYVLTPTRGFVIEQELTPLDKVDLKTAQERVCSAMQNYPLYWCEESEFDTVLVDRLAEVRGTTSIAAIHDVLGLDTFRQW